MIFPLSNPTANSECTPADALAWTGGRAIIASGSPFPGIAQCNNMYIFPGMGLAALVSGARRITDGMFRAAATTLAGLSSGDQLYPPLGEIRRISAAIAFAASKCAQAEEVADPVDDATLRTRIAAAMWDPTYVPYRRSPSQT